MLTEAIELQQNAVEQLIEKIKFKDEITFRAPTGSGKTYMMADFMNRILESSSDVVFLVSTLSKSDLARQNYEQFCKYKQNADFSNLNPFLISSEISGEERLFIPTDYNVYLLPRDLYKNNGRLMQGAMENFLWNMTANKVFGGCGKTIYLIKDECHIATNNLDNLSSKFFTKTLNFSATPNLRRGQNPDVEITDDAAVAAKLIKRVELGAETETVGDAITKFENIKESYRNLLGVNPCLIIQISNKDKADYEWENLILPELKKAEHQDLKWMLIVDKQKNCDSNDILKAKKIPVSKWKDYAKKNTAAIDIIIFKMVISEGWDIPRACMLYQIRDSQSKQLDEQVMGRVRRNPRLMDFETLSEDAQKLAMTAWVWGLIPEKGKKVYSVKLWNPPSDITDNLQLHTTRLKALGQKVDFNVKDFLQTQPNTGHYGDIFTLYHKLKKSDISIRNLCNSYSDSTTKWFDFTEHLDEIVRENNKYICNYSQSMENTKDEEGNEMTFSFPIESQYTDNSNYVNISEWVWKRKDGKNIFAFDSEAERNWVSLLKDLANERLSANSSEQVAKKVTVGNSNPYAGETNLLGEVEPEKLEPKASTKLLWGKNYPINSEIKFEYYLDGIHSSYPDFILKDCFDRIHLFEVKSVNLSNNTPTNFDSAEYNRKIEELKKCYKQASSLTGYIFYLPVLKDDTWHITRLMNGTEDTLTEDMFKNFIKTRPTP